MRDAREDKGHSRGITNRLLTTNLSNTVRKSIARVLTTINAKTRANLREMYKGKKHIPLDLRTKKTRAIRRRLTKVHSLFAVLLYGRKD